MKSTQLGSISREWPAFCGRSICRWLGTHRGTEWVSSRRWASLASEGMPSTSSSVSSTRQGFCENFRIYDLFLFTWTFHGHYLHAVICMQLLLTGASIKEEIQRWWWRRWTLGWPFFKKINSVWYQNELLGAISLFHLCKNKWVLCSLLQTSLFDVHLLLGVKGWWSHNCANRQKKTPRYSSVTVAQTLAANNVIF